MLSVIPSLKYSMSGSLLALTIGMMASEVIALRAGRLRDCVLAQDDGTTALRADAAELKVSAGCEPLIKPILCSRLVNRSSERSPSSTGSDLSQISQPSRSSYARLSHRKDCSVSPNAA